ncbi:sugar porter family MFS transporter [Glycomyces xiaoerkulensis]|uniref:sugar porter family MFS transporter n=1 Tax=Glycomyces xiaoerkulensis TaxID=2038139 RepID=UPI000C267939|nr:sugar porter family MFS transporter [Glycomyces xiaoerkulensis]
MPKDHEELVDSDAAKPSSAVFVSVAAALGGFLFGYDTAVINGTVEAIERAFDLGGVQVGFVVSSALLGCAVGAWFAGALANHFGRPRVMLMAGVLFFVSALGSALSAGPVDLTFWRVIGGLAVGAASVIAPAYIAEMAPANLRGRLGSLQQFAIVLGIFFSLLVNFVIQGVSGGASEPAPWGGPAWRWMFAAEAVPAFMYFMIALHIPESPRYLVATRQVDKAKAVLRKYVGGDVRFRIEEIQESLHTDKPMRLSEIRGPRLGLLPVVWVGILLSMFQQFVGINVIFYYSTSLWQSVGFSESNSFLTSVFTSFVNIVGTIIAILLIDRLGRRRLLLSGSSVMLVTLATMAVTFSTATVDSEGDLALSTGAGAVALVAANLYVLGFAFTWGPVVWVLLGEMFPNRIRASALGVAAAAQWISNWMITTTFPELAEIGLSLAYGLYATFALLSLLFVFKAVPETKGIELEDMEDLEKIGKVRPSEP